eukprot:Sdes_comp13556_c0_seq1m3231
MFLISILKIYYFGVLSLFNQIFTKHINWKVPKLDFANTKGLVCIVTGGSSGIGYETAKGLVNAGYCVVIASRSPAKGRQAVEALRAGLKENGLGGFCENIKYIPLDLGSFVSIRRFLYTFKRFRFGELPAGQLNVLINNAGVMLTPYGCTEDGLELQTGINHFGHFLLTCLLLPFLERSSRVDLKGRIVNVSSCAHFAADGNFDEITNPSDYSPHGSYASSKLANVLFTFELSRRLQNKNITVNCLHPGVVATDLYRHLPGFLLKLQSFLAQIFFYTAEQGASTSLFVATSATLESVSGSYFVNCEPSPSSSLSYDKSLQNNLWTLSQHRTKYMCNVGKNLE